MPISKVDRNCYSQVENWSEYDYLFDLIMVEKRNPYLQGHHPLEEIYPLLKLIAKSEIKEQSLRSHLIYLLEENIEE